VLTWTAAKDDQKTICSDFDISFKNIRLISAIGLMID
jgi:hypothetical protein